MNIEELAFKDRRTLVNLNEPDLLNIIEFLQIDRKQWINQFSKTHNESIDIQKENKDLKKQLHEASLTIQEMTEQDIECPSNCEKLRRLEKQLEEVDFTVIPNCDIKPLIDKFRTQQKEFIKYLEDKIYTIEPKGIGINYNCEYDSEEDYIRAMEEQSRLNTLKEILQKYKTIIGDDK